jgi:hypothetical protein
VLRVHPGVRGHHREVHTDYQVGYIVAHQAVQVTGLRVPDHRKAHLEEEDRRGRLEEDKVAGSESEC